MIIRERSIAVDNLVLSANIGIYPHEHEAPQRVRFSFSAVVDLPETLADDISDVISYEAFVLSARALVKEKHFSLLETLVDELANSLFEDKRMLTLSVRGEKLDVFPDAESASVTVKLARK